MVKYFFDEDTFQRFKYFAFPLNSSSHTIVVEKEDFVNFFEKPSYYRHKINMLKSEDQATEVNVG